MGTCLSTLRLTTRERELYLTIVETLSVNNFTFSKGSLSKKTLKKFVSWMVLNFPETDKTTITENSFWDTVGNTIYMSQTKQDFSVTNFLPLFHIITKTIEKSNSEKSSKLTDLSSSYANCADKITEECALQATESLGAAELTAETTSEAEAKQAAPTFPPLAGPALPNSPFPAAPHLPGSVSFPRPASGAPFPVPAAVPSAATTPPPAPVLPLPTPAPPFPAPGCSVAVPPAPAAVPALPPAPPAAPAAFPGPVIAAAPPNPALLSSTPATALPSVTAPAPAPTETAPALPPPPATFPSHAHNLSSCAEPHTCAVTSAHPTPVVSQTRGIASAPPNPPGVHPQPPYPPCPHPSLQPLTQPSCHPNGSETTCGVPPPTQSGPCCSRATPHPTTLTSGQSLKRVKNPSKRKKRNSRVACASQCSSCD
ncbi:uncharacterized protein LOC141725993 [Zonotrichia albicollis]|uniref:uncharacterized protein LOC141725993 n=1 Tax=Zonotrichia albicollis TaxID=44394 RepID=UPI003D80EFF3